MITLGGGDEGGFGHPGRRFGGISRALRQNKLNK